MSAEQPPRHRFTSRGFIVTDDIFGTSDPAEEHFDLFKKSVLPSYDSIFDPEEITFIQDNPIDVAIDIKCIVKEMHPYTNTMTKVETLAEAKQSRDLFYAMQCGK